MQERYIVKLNGEEIGYAVLRKVGMYYNLHFRVKHGRYGAYRLICKTKEKCTDLGACVPYSEGYGMDRCIPAKLIGFGELMFELVEKVETFLPICDNSPFLMLDRLLDAHFTNKNGVKGIVFKNNI